MLEGGHRFPSKAGSMVEKWIDRVFIRRVAEPPCRPV
jgi:hypothetical protein